MKRPALRRRWTWIAAAALAALAWWTVPPLIARRMLANAGLPVQSGTLRTAGLHLAARGLVLRAPTGPAVVVGRARIGLRGGVLEEVEIGDGARAIRAERVTLVRGPLWSVEAGEVRLDGPGAAGLLRELADALPPTPPGKPFAPLTVRAHLTGLAALGGEADLWLVLKGQRGIVHCTGTQGEVAATVDRPGTWHAAISWMGASGYASGDPARVVVAGWSPPLPTLGPRRVLATGQRHDGSWRCQILSPGAVALQGAGTLAGNRLLGALHQVRTGPALLPLREGWATFSVDPSHPEEVRAFATAYLHHDPRLATGPVCAWNVNGASGATLGTVRVAGKEWLRGVAATGEGWNLPGAVRLRLPGRDRDQEVRFSPDAEHMDLDLPLEDGRTVRATWTPAAGAQAARLTVHFPGGDAQAALTSILLPVGLADPLDATLLVASGKGPESLQVTGHLAATVRFSDGSWTAALRDASIITPAGRWRVSCARSGGHGRTGRMEDLRAELGTLRLEADDVELARDAVRIPALRASSGGLSAKVRQLEIGLRAGLPLQADEASVQMALLPERPPLIAKGRVAGALLPVPVLDLDRLGLSIGKWERTGGRAHLTTGAPGLRVLATLPGADPGTAVSAEVTRSGDGARTDALVACAAFPAAEADKVLSVLDLAPVALAEGILHDLILRVAAPDAGEPDVTATARIADLSVRPDRAQRATIEGIHGHLAARANGSSVQVEVGAGSLGQRVPFTLRLDARAGAPLALTGHLGPASMQDLVEGFLDFLPEKLAFGEWSGAAETELSGALDGTTPYLQTDFRLDGVSFRSEDGGTSIRGATGPFPLRYHFTDPGHELRGFTSVDREEFPAAWEQAAAATGAPALVAEAVSYAGLTIGPARFDRPEVDEAGATWLRLHPTALFHGEAAGAVRIRLGLKGSAATGQILVRALSLDSLCEAYPPIAGYVRGRMNVSLSLRNEGLRIHRLSGVLRAWADPKEAEPMDVSKAFLIAVGGEAFREVFKGDRLPYDAGAVEASLKEGNLAFHSLELHHDAFGLQHLLRRDISYAVRLPPRGSNKVSLNRVLALMKRSRATPEVK